MKRVIIFAMAVALLSSGNLYAKFGLKSLEDYVNEAPAVIVGTLTSAKKVDFNKYALTLTVKTEIKGKVKEKTITLESYSGRLYEMPFVDYKKMENGEFIWFLTKTDSGYELYNSDHYMVDLSGDGVKITSKTSSERIAGWLTTKHLEKIQRILKKTVK